MIYSNQKHNDFLSMIIVLSAMAIGFMMSCIVNEPIKGHTLSKRRIEPIPVEIEVVKVDYSTTDPVADYGEQLRRAIGEAKRLEANKSGEYSQYEMALMAKVVHAEAGNQDDVGKRLIVDVILNRLDAEEFPNTIEGVVTQENQFAMYEWYTIDDLNAVTDEIVDRTDKEIVFFRRGHYHSIGEPAYQYGDHFFSTM